MNLKNPKDFWAGVMFAAIGFTFAAIVMISKYPMGTAGRMGAGYFPFYLGLILGVLGLVILGKALASTGTPLSKFAWKPLLWVLGSVLVFAFGLKWVGLLSAIMVLVVVSSYAQKKVNAMELVAYVPLVALAIAIGYIWNAAARALQIPALFELGAIVLGLGYERPTQFLSIGGTIFANIVLSGGIAVSGWVLYVVCRKLSFRTSFAETLCLASVLASASWAIFVLGLRLPFPVWPIFVTS